MGKTMTIKAPPKGLAFSLTTGVSVRLAPNEEREVAPYIAIQAQKRGANILYSNTPVPPLADDELTPAQLAELRKVLEAIVAEGRPAHFTAQGRPRLNIVSSRCSFQPTVPQIVEQFEHVME